MKHHTVRGQQFAEEFNFRGVAYKITGRFGFVKIRPRGRVCDVLVSEAKGPEGELTWSSSEGDFYVCPANEDWPASTADVFNIFTA